MRKYSRFPLSSYFHHGCSCNIADGTFFHSDRTAQRSLAEISSLQSQLIEHLATQTEHIDQLVADSSLTTENVEGGNKQLKKATQRPSAARFTFYAASGLCAFLVLWDLII